MMVEQQIESDVGGWELDWSSAAAENPWHGYLVRAGRGPRGSERIWRMWRVAIVAAAFVLRAASCEG